MRNFINITSDYIYSVELVQGSPYRVIQCCYNVHVLVYKLFSSCKYLSLPCKSHSCYVDPWPFLLWWTLTFPIMSTPLHSHQDVKSGIILRTVMTSVPFSRWLMLNHGLSPLIPEREILINKCSSSLIRLLIKICVHEYFYRPFTTPKSKYYGFLMFYEMSV